MSVVSKNSAKDTVTITKLLIIQFIVFVFVSLLLFLKHPNWTVPSLCGGFSAWLPNLVFALFTRHTLTSEPVSSAISWSFMLAWVFKMMATLMFMLVAVQVFKAEFTALGLGFLSVIIMQFLAPIVVSVIK